MGKETKLERSRKTRTNGEGAAPTLGELAAVQKRGTVRDDQDMLFTPSRANWAPKVVNKRTRKSRPREISSKYPVPLGRDRCLGIDNNSANGRSVKRFDPRFEDHCGDLREEHVERNYLFINGLREKRKRELQGALKKASSKEDAQYELDRMEQEDKRRDVLQRRKEILQKVRTEEKEAVKKGKNPYFLKEKDVRKLELKAKFEQLKKGGGIKKYIEKRRRKLAGKDKKLLPERRARE